MKTVIQSWVLTLSALFIVQSTLLAQAQIIGKVADNAGKPLPYANVLLLNAKDSSFIKGDIAREDGGFAIQNAAIGNYLVEISMVGFVKKYSTAFQLTPQYLTKNLGTTTLNEMAELATVEVVTKKPLFEQKIDRLVVNVENSITSAGSTALDVLERSPGIVVNRQDNSISMSGKAGVVVMINGKLNYMTPEAATQMLAGMSANSIEKIELLATPPANLDAEGNAGYINIVLKKNQNEGLNGSYALSAGYGKGAVGNGSFNLNYRYKKWTVYGGYDYVHFGQQQYADFYRRISLNNKIIETVSKTLAHPNENNNNARLGIDYQLNTKTTIGASVTAYSRHMAKGYTTDAQFSSNQKLDTVVQLKVNEVNTWQNIGANVNMQHTFREGEILSFSADYLHFVNNQPVNYDNIWTDGEDVFLKNQMIRSDKNTPLSIAVSKLDYVRNLGKKGKIEMGIKAVMSQFKNDVAVATRTSTAPWITDPTLTAVYDLKENIGAAYTSYEVKLNTKTTFKGGLRYEYTQSNLGTIEKPNIVDRKYGRFFPSLFLSHDVDKNVAWGISYSRRITRPTFNELAPFTFFVDPYTYFAGNAALQPSISDNLKADYRFKTTLVSLQYSYQNQPIARFQTQIEPNTNRSISISQNLNSDQTYALTIGQTYSPVKWWTMYVNLAGVYSQVSATNNGHLVTVKFPKMTLFSTQLFSLPKHWSFEVSGNYNSGGLFGISKLKSFGAVNAGFQKKMNKNGGKLSFGYDNIFNTSRYRVILDLPEQQQYFYTFLQFTQPKFKISWTQNFGNQKMKASAKRADVEEKGRVE